MFVPKLVCEAPYTFRFVCFVRVDCGLRYQQHSNGTELRMKRYFDQSSEIMLLKANKVLEPAENSFHRHPFPVCSPQLLRPMRPEPSVNTQNALHACLLVTGYKITGTVPKLIAVSSSPVSCLGIRQQPLELHSG